MGFIIMEHLTLMWNVKRCVMSCLTFWRSTGIQRYEICHQNLGIRKKKKQSNFFYGFFCLLRSDGFWGFNSFVVLMEVYVGLVRFQKKRISWCSDCFQTKSWSEFLSCSCNFSSENATGCCQEQEEQGRKLLQLVAACCLFLITRSDGHDIINTML